MVKLNCFIIKQKNIEYRIGKYMTKLHIFNEPYEAENLVRNINKLYGKTGKHSIKHENSYAL